MFFVDRLLAAMIELETRGTIGHLALSSINAAQLTRALERTPIVAVQDLFNGLRACGRARRPHKSQSPGYSPGPR